MVTARGFFFPTLGLAASLSCGGVACNSATPDSEQAVSDGTNFYTLAGSHVLRVSVADASQTELPLDWNHTNGALLVDDRYVYTAMHGCPALTRIDKQTLAKEVMEIDGVSYPGRGRSALAKAGDALVCGSPSEIFVIDTWGSEARRIFTDVHQGFSVAATDDQVFFLEDGDEWATIGAVPVAGGGGQRLLEDQDGGFAVPLLSAPAIGKVIWGNHRGVRSLDTRDSNLGQVAFWQRTQRRGGFDRCLRGHGGLHARNGERATGVSARVLDRSRIAWRADLERASEPLKTSG